MLWHILNLKLYGSGNVRSVWEEKSTLVSSCSLLFDVLYSQPIPGDLIPVRNKFSFETKLNKQTNSDDVWPYFVLRIKKTF